MVSNLVTFEGLHCMMQISRPAPGYVILKISGNDTGEFGNRPFQELTFDLENSKTLHLFIDARDTKGASIHVSADWAAWIYQHRNRLRRVTMLTRSRFIHLTADFVRQFTKMGESMCVMTDEWAFDHLLTETLHIAANGYSCR